MINLVYFLRMMSNMKRSRRSVLAQQDKMLRKLLHHAMDHSPYYAERFAQAGITAENMDTMPITAFPTIDKTELLANYDRVVTNPAITQEKLRRYDADPASVPELAAFHVVHSSGSTALPSYFVYDEQSWQYLIAGGVRAATFGMTIQELAKVLLRPIRVMYAAITTGSFGGVMLVGGALDTIKAREERLDVNEPLGQWKQKITAFQPDYILGYPSAMKIIAEQMQRGDLELHVGRLVSGGEPLSPALRTYLEKAFGAQVINYYAASESLMLGIETNYDRGFTLYDDMNLIEVVDGKMYLTNLYNYVQPLIRYCLSDRIELLPPEEKGLPFSRCRVLGGRDEDIIWFYDGKGNRDFLHPLLFEDFCIPGLLDYQLRQTAPDHFSLVFAAEIGADTGGIREKLTEEIRQILEEHDLKFVTYDVQQTGSIPPDPRTGKKKLVLNLPEMQFC